MCLKFVWRAFFLRKYLKCKIYKDSDSVFKAVICNVKLACGVYDF